MEIVNNEDGSTTVTLNTVGSVIVSIIFGCGVVGIIKVVASLF